MTTRAPIRSTGLRAAVVVGVVVAGALVAPPVLAAGRVTPCSRGLVALTFDDGPATTVTPRLVKLLGQLDVKATFFMVGSRLRTAPREGRMVASAGHVIANHSWSHADLTRLSDSSIRSQLATTRQEMRRAGLTPSRLMRPPYGAINARVNRVVRGEGYVPVLWTIDTKDYAGGTSSQIAERVLSRLRPHKGNIVLQHDGVRRSPTSVEAVPKIVRGARARGYCFATLNSSGQPAAPVPSLRTSVTGAKESGKVPARVTLTLDEPTSRRVSVMVTTHGGTATSGADFQPVSRRVEFAVGATRATLTVPVVDDADVEDVERFTVRLGSPSGLKLATRSRSVTITSDDAAPPPPPPPPPPTTAAPLPTTPQPKQGPARAPSAPSPQPEPTSGPSEQTPDPASTEATPVAPG